MDIGFTPQPNQAWNTSTASLGFWYRRFPNQSGSSGNEEEAYDHKFDPPLLHRIHEDCQWYTDEFEEAFIRYDRTWKVARIMARVSGAGSFASAVLSWTFVGPLICPVSFLWPGVLLPFVMISFIAEGSKFLFFDMEICRNNIFWASGSNGENAIPETVDSCGLGDSAVHSIAACVLLLIALLLVCFKVPDERQLDLHFGLPYEGTTDPSENYYDDDDDEMNRRTRSNTSSSSRKDLRGEQAPDDNDDLPLPIPKQQRNGGRGGGGGGMDDRVEAEEKSEYSADEYDNDNTNKNGNSPFGFPTVAAEVNDSVEENKSFPRFSTTPREPSRSDLNTSSSSHNNHAVVVNKADTSFHSTTSSNEGRTVRHRILDDILGLPIGDDDEKDDYDDEEEERKSLALLQPVLGSSSTLLDVDASRISHDGSRFSSTLDSLDRRGGGAAAAAATPIATGEGASDISSSSSLEDDDLVPEFDYCYSDSPLSLPNHQQQQKQHFSDGPPESAATTAVVSPLSLPHSSPMLLRSRPRS